MRLALLLTLLASAAPAGAFELPRWMGTWHEIAHIPNRPQAGCSDTVVHYRADGRGGFELSNTCWKADAFKDYRGRAVPTEDPKRFRARFFYFLRSDYWILDHDPDYRSGAVGTQDRAQLWIISRDPVLDEAAYARLVAAARERGFPVEKLVRTAVTGRGARRGASRR